MANDDYSLNPCSEITLSTPLTPGVIITASYAAVNSSGLPTVFIWNAFSASSTFIIDPLSSWYMGLNDCEGRNETCAFLRTLRELRVLLKEDVNAAANGVESFCKKYYVPNLERLLKAKEKRIKHKNDHFDPIAKYEMVMKGKRYSGGKRR